MTGKIKDTEYLYSSSRVRALEKSLLGKERIDRMIEAAGDDEAFKVLAECGYGDLTGGNAGLEAALSAQRSSVFALLDSIAPDKRLVDVFRIKYDYHNLKTLIKAAAKQEDASELLIDVGRVPAKNLIEMLNQSSYRDMPPVMAEATVDATDLLSRTENPQLSDFILDSACLSEMLDTARALDSEFLTGYVKVYIDAANIRSYVRTGRIKKGYDFLRLVLIPGGYVEQSRLFDLSLSGGSIEELYASGPFEQAAVLASSALRADTTLTSFEKEVDDVVVRYLKKARYTSFGEQSLAAYLAAKELEITSIRTIMAGRRANLPSDTIREKLREAYV